MHLITYVINLAYHLAMSDPHMISLLCERQTPSFIVIFLAVMIDILSIATSSMKILAQMQVSCHGRYVYIVPRLSCMPEAISVHVLFFEMVVEAVAVALKIEHCSLNVIDRNFCLV